VTFAHREPLGMATTGSGAVAEVKAGGAAARAGVRVGWCVCCHTLAGWVNSEFDIAGQHAHIHTTNVSKITAKLGREK
jgi:hypothetical protein